MKVVKTQVVLFMYEKLLIEGELSSAYIKEKFELENKISEIKAKKRLHLIPWKY
jgi:hypothetical protein